ncbi:hypothetical protein LZ30DRAFT_697357 [Colletotrichum cereale]|nr:hypothetical protein LZ30DRAFT_697357 [Colletotrichum cereale]
MRDVGYACKVTGCCCCAPTGRFFNVAHCAFHVVRVPDRCNRRSDVMVTISLKLIKP